MALREWQIEHVGHYVTKFEFAAILKRASAKVENAVNGFRDAGLFPLDASVVLKTDKLQTSVLFNRSEKNQEEKPQSQTQSQNSIDTSTQEPVSSTCITKPIEHKNVVDSQKQMTSEIHNDSENSIQDTNYRCQSRTGK